MQTVAKLKGMSLLMALGAPFACAQNPAFAVDETSAPVALPPALPLPVGQIGDTVSLVPPLLWLLPAVLLPLLLWGGLAWWRAWLTEPMRLRRRGVSDLRRLRDELGRGEAAPTTAQMFRCLRGIACSWGIAEATPTPEQARAAVLEITGSEEEAGRWRALWQLTEQGLYSSGGCVAADWLSALHVCTESLQPPRRLHRFPSNREHWLPPVAALGLVVLAATPQPAPAAAVVEPREVWEQALAEDGRDWAAHHNLARALLEESEFNLAVAHALSAFLLHSSADTRQLLQASLARAGTADPTLRYLFGDAAMAGVPARHSPAAWQRLAMGFALLLAAGLGVAVVGLYRVRRRYWLTVGASIALSGFAALVVSQASWSAYGDLRHGNAAILLQSANLRPEPTNLVPNEESSPLPGGAVVRVHRRFLSWIQVQGAVGKPGWVRATMAMPLYGDMPGAGEAPR